MGPPTTTVRVSVDTRDRLRRLSKRRGVSTGKVLDELAAQAEEQVEVQEWAEGLRSLPAEQRRAYQDELADWDAVAGDGLGDDA
jgi:predicted DNA-binding protein